LGQETEINMRNPRNTKSPILILTLVLLSGCAQQAYFPAGVSSSASYGEGQRAGSLHEKYSQKYADEKITRGKDNAMTIGMRFGEATFADRTEDGDIVWAYQARSPIVSTDAKSGAHVNAGLFSASTASAVNVNTETTSKVTTLRIVFDSAGVVKDFYSERESN
jgi:hypothetical protein